MTPRFTKVAVAGKIDLGLALELVQAPRPLPSDVFASGGVGSPIHYDTRTAKESEAIGEALEWRLVDGTKQTLSISGAGLTTSFGIFGAPGSGKTVLLLHVLQQVLAHERADRDRRYGALILDPKAALVDDVRKMVERAGRTDDLVIINTDVLNSARDHLLDLNVIDARLDPYELGTILVLAGQAAGSGASDPFWFQEWTNLFASALGILRAHAYLEAGLRGSRTTTLRDLLDSLFDEEGGVRRIRAIASQVAARADELPSTGSLGVPAREDIRLDVQMLERFYRQDYVGTVEAFITKSYGMFRRKRLHCYSAPRPRGSLYDDIIERGKIILVSVSPGEPALAKTLCTLVKCLFQRTVLSRGTGFANVVRPVVLACDEYGEIASEVQGQPLGDGQFLALARQYGCMALLATQSVNVLEASSLKETWRSVFSNFAAKIYMRLVDNETAEEATKLAGESDWRVFERGQTSGGGGASSSRQKALRDRKNLPSSILTQVLRRGEAVVIGSLDGGESMPGTYFLRVPKPEKASVPDA
jgi:type IV secretory system conjugative DNA transfer VirD4/TraG family protein